jgi:hypothetical protein
MNRFWAFVVDGIVRLVQVSDEPLGDGFVECGNGLRGNYPGPGYIYDAGNDVFYAPSPYPSWTLDQDWQWIPPTPKPDDGKFYMWNEQTLSWIADE